MKASEAVEGHPKGANLNLKRSEILHLFGAWAPGCERLPCSQSSDSCVDDIQEQGQNRRWDNIHMEANEPAKVVESGPVEESRSGWISKQLFRSFLPW